MLYVDIKVNRDKIGGIKVRNLGIEESYARGLTGTKRWYKYEVLLNGEIVHDRKDGALKLIERVLAKVERVKVLNCLSEFFNQGSKDEILEK